MGNHQPWLVLDLQWQPSELTMATERPSRTVAAMCLDLGDLGDPMDDLVHGCWRGHDDSETLNRGFSK